MKDGILLRVNMLGVGPEGYKVWMEDNSIFFKGAGEREHESEDPRTYEGTCQLDLEVFKAEEFETQMRNGVLMVLMKGQLKRTLTHFDFRPGAPC